MPINVCLCFFDTCVDKNNLRQEKVFLFYTQLYHFYSLFLQVHLDSDFKFEIKKVS